MDAIATNIKPRVLEPGLWRHDPYRERYLVPGGGSIVFELLPDDELRVVDPEGRQIAEIVPFAPDGRPDPGALSDQTTTDAIGIKEILSSDQESARQVTAGLARRGAMLPTARAIILFSNCTPSAPVGQFKVIV